MKSPEIRGAAQGASAKQIDELKVFTKDIDYLSYISLYNGGYYYNGALQLYSLHDEGEWEDILIINNRMRFYYLDDFEDLFSFGQDTFGNQFCFDNNGNVLFFNIETAEVEMLADSFYSWENVLLDEFEYLTGTVIRDNFLELWDLKIPDRLCPKVPFVAGGEYEISNLYGLHMSRCIEVNSNIARQVKNLPDGSSIKFESIE